MRVSSRPGSPPSASWARAARTTPCCCVALPPTRMTGWGSSPSTRCPVGVRACMGGSGQPRSPADPPAAAMLAPAEGPLSEAQALELGFKWHAGPETRRADADADMPLWMRCRCPGKVLVCCVVVGCLLGTRCTAGWALGRGGILLLHREWDWGTQPQLLHRGPQAILCRAV